MDQLTRCAAIELAPIGVRVNAVNPGVTVTNLHRRSGMDETQVRGVPRALEDDASAGAARPSRTTIAETDPVSRVRSRRAG